MTTKEKIEVMQAFLDGKLIEYKLSSDGDIWLSVSDPHWDWDNCIYRIKPESKFRPYKDGKEFMEALSTHGAWISPKNAKETKGFVILKFNDYNVLIFTDTLVLETVLYDVLLKNYVWTKDNTPCGIEEEHP